MKINTSRFGELEYHESDVLLFDQGIPGFRQENRFLLLPQEDSPFMYLQSIKTGDLSFIVVSPFDFFKEYEFELPSHIQEELSLDDKKEIIIITIVSIRKELELATVNLVAPIIVNKTDRRGCQYILPDSHYSIQQPLFGEIVKSGGVG